MEKLKMQTADMAERNIEILGQMFPNCLTEVKNDEGKTVRAIDFDKLRQELACEVVEGADERYQFTWPDKRNAIRLANASTNKTLRPCREESVDFDNTENLYVEGDNLEVLKLLRENYLGKVKMIYIDPPYNTGNDFVYNDDFAQGKAEFEAQSGLFDEEGRRMADPMVQNTESNGRFHTDWLNMIYPRLKVAKDLLSDDGVIFISIDENEVENLKRISDEIFGSKNFIAELIWSAGRKNDSKYISISHEYILCYFKNSDYIKENKIVWREKKQGLDAIYTEYERLKKVYISDVKSIEKQLKTWYKSLPDGHPAKDHSHYCRVDENGIFFADNISWPGGGGPKYQVLHPVTQKPVVIPSRGWLVNEKTMKEWVAQGKVLFGETEQSVPTLKAYLKDREYSVPYSVFYRDGRAASKRLATLMGDKVFENPKDEEIIQRLIEFSGVNNGDIVMDFFSGSASTAHSVFLASINKQINLKFILVQIPEEISESKATAERGKKVARAAISLCESMRVPNNICEIGKERIRRAGKKIKADNATKEGIERLDIGFRVLKLDESNMADVYYTPAETPIQQTLDFDKLVDNIREGRTAEDLLFQVLPECNLPLSSKIEIREIHGKKVFVVNDGYLMACFDKDINESVITAIAKEKPYYFVMCDRSIATDNVADNFDQIFNAYSKETVRRIL